MNYYAWTGLINGMIGTVCGVIIFFQDPKNFKNRISSLYFLSVTVWSYFYCFWQINQDPRWALLLVRGLMAGAIWIPIFQFHSVLTLFSIHTPRWRFFLRVGYVLTVVFFIFNFTPYFVNRVEPRLGFPFWPIPGPVFHPYLTMFVGLTVFSVYLIWNLRKSFSSPVTRNQVVWVSVGAVIGYTGGGSNFFLWYDIPIKPYLNFSATLFFLINALLFFKLSLVDFRLFFRDTTVHVLASLAIGGAFALAMYPLVQRPIAILLMVVLAIMIPLVYRPVYRGVLELVNRTRLGSIDQYLQDYQRTLGKVRESSFTYDDLARNLVEAVMQSFPVTMAAIYFNDDRKKELQLRAQRGMSNPQAANLKLNRSALAVPFTDPLIAYFKDNPGLVLRQNFEMPMRTGAETEIAASLRRMEAEVAVPFHVAGKLQGMLLMGSKKNHLLFHNEDLEAVASYARMGEDIMRYIVGMEHEIRHAALYSHDMNNDTKSLVQVLQFVRSPLAKQVPDEKLREMLGKAEDVAVRLNQSFQLNRDRSALILKSIKGEYEKSPVDILRVVRASCDKFVFTAKEKSISLKVVLPEGTIVVNGNEFDLTRVVDNLLSNAFRYVDAEGEICVAGTPVDTGFRFVVADTGRGIAPEMIEKIWDIGWQVRDSKQGASGLGLSIVKQIVDMHEGKIQVSPGENGKGTAFSVWLPKAA